MQELDSVVTRARMFQHKPDGQVTIMMLQDSHGVPASTMQDPMHYPHGTKFLAPGVPHRAVVTVSTLCDSLQFVHPVCCIFLALHHCLT